jgi:parallel beta-helix repeat protein
MYLKRGLVCLALAGGLALADEGRNPPSSRTWSPALEGDARAASAVRSGHLQPVALAAADFDGDLRPDIVAAYSDGASGALVLYRSSGAPTGAFFRGEAQIVALDFAPEFIAAADFDNDARADVLVAARGERSLALVPGDGAGTLGEVQEIALPGALTAFAAGDINAMDGVVDVAVALASGARSALLILESPLGVADAAEADVEVEELALPAPATSLAIGNANGDPFDDIVVAAGREMLVVAGRDRRLTEPRSVRVHVPDLTATSRTLDFEPRQVVLESLSGAQVDDIVLVDEAGSASMTTAARRTPPAALDRRGPQGSAIELALRLDDDAHEDLVELEEGALGALTTTLFAPAATFTVTTTADAGAGSLRDAINQANALAGPDTIRFGLPAGPQTISPLSALPVITDSLTIDGTTQPGYAGSPLVSVTGVGAGVVNGLVYSGAASGASAVLALNVRDFHGYGILLNGSSNDVIDGCTIGTDPVGSAAAPNTIGIGVYGAQNTRIGTTKGNVISGNSGSGVVLQGGGPVPSSYSSADVPKVLPDLATASSTLTVGDETLIEDLDVTLDITHTFDGDLQITLFHPDGTSVPLALNRGGSGNHFTNTIFDDEAATAIFFGVPPFAGSFRPEQPLSAFDGKPGTGTWRLEIRDTAGGDSGTLNSWSIRYQHLTTGNQVLNNRIGTNAAGTAALGNAGHGVEILNEQMDRIGLPGQRNVISGNGFAGIYVDGSLAYGNHFENNHIGTDVTGTLDLGNVGSGILLTSGARGNTIGGAAAGTGNVVSGQDTFGVELTVARENRVLGNYIGTNVTGTVALRNGVGIHVNNGSTGNTIGGVTPGSGNVISGNGQGVYIDLFGSNANVLVRNRIGTDVSGMGDLGNEGTGIAIDGNQTIVGDALAANGNVVSGNDGDGIFLSGRENWMAGNIVGLDASMNAALPNAGSGVFVNDRSNAIGDPIAPQNVIAGNGVDGVRVVSCCTTFQSFASTDTPKPLPDNVTTTSTITVSVAAYVVEVEVGINLTHTFDRDLRINLIDPSGGRILLADRRGGSDDNYTNTVFDDEAATPIAAGTAPFTGVFIPDRPLSIADGVHADGSWKLEIADVAAQDSGTLLSWTLMLTFVDSMGNVIDRNVIGTNPAGQTGLGNTLAGVHLIGAAGNRIGDSGNVIAGNRFGILMEGALSAGTFVHQNLIGSVGQPATNALDGIVLDGAIGTIVTTNTIAGNGGAGIAVRSGYNNEIRFNQMLRNGGLGIDLEPGPGVTPNDATDGDSGANGLQNYPLITSKVPVGPSTQVDGILRSTPLTSFTIDLYDSFTADPSGYGEGDAHRGVVTVTTDATGNAPFSFVVGGTVALPTTTATGPGGNTSEFSGAFAWPQEVPDTVTVGKAGSQLKVNYVPACGAANHAVFWGASPIGATLVWTGGTCPLGTSGMFQFDPGLPPPGSFIYFVVVGQTAGLEGSYGQDSALVERPEATLAGICDVPRSLGGFCP